MIELSLALGKTLEELRQMPESDFRLYQQYYAKQPFGQWRNDYNAALVAQVMAGSVGGNAPKLTELMPFWFEPENAADTALDDLFSGAVEL